MGEKAASKGPPSFILACLKGSPLFYSGACDL